VTLGNIILIALDLIHFYSNDCTWMEIKKLQTKMSCLLLQPIRGLNYEHGGFKRKVIINLC
jgi:hypothetical protein